jgi:hypothetical protein
VTEHPLGDNLFIIRRHSCRKPDGTGGFRMHHAPIIVDEELAHVECGTCLEKLNPIQVILNYAQHEAGLVSRWHHIKDAIAKQEFQIARKNRVRCEHCSKLTRIKK